MFAISVMSMYWIGGTKFSVDPNDAAVFTTEENAAATAALIPIQHQMQIVCLNGPAPQQGVVDLAAPGAVPAPAAHPQVNPAARSQVNPATRNDVIGTKVGRQGQRVNIGGQVPNTQPVTWTPGMPVHRLNPRRTGGEQDQMQKNWGRSKGSVVAGLGEDGAVTDRAEFAPGQQVDPLS